MTIEDLEVFYCSFKIWRSVEDLNFSYFLLVMEELKVLYYLWETWRSISVSYSFRGKRDHSKILKYFFFFENIPNICLHKCYFLHFQSLLFRVLIAGYVWLRVDKNIHVGIHQKKKKKKKNNHCNNANIDKKRQP